MSSIKLRVGTILGPREAEITQDTTIEDIILDVCKQLNIPSEYTPAFVLVKRTAKFSVECMDRRIKPFFSILHDDLTLFLRIALFPAPDVVKHLNRHFQLLLLEQVQRALVTHIWKVPSEYLLVLSAFYYIIISGSIPNPKTPRLYPQLMKATAGKFISSDILSKYSDKTFTGIFKRIFTSILKQDLIGVPDDAIQHYFNVIGTAVKQYGYACFPGNVRQFDRLSPESDTILLLSNKGILFLNQDLSENTGYTYDAIKAISLNTHWINLTVMIGEEPKEMVLEVEHVDEIVSFIQFYSSCALPAPYVAPV